MSTVNGPFTGPPPTLTDGVVTLREIRADDTEALIEYCSDPEMNRWMSFPQPFTRVDADNARQCAETDWSTGERYQFAIEANGSVVGGVNLERQGDRLAEVGYGLIGAYRGRGLMVRALRLILTWGFHQAGIDVVHWQAQVGNWASRRAAWAVGFRVDAAIPGLLEHRGTRVDGWLAALRRNDPLQPVHPWYDSATLMGTTAVLRAADEKDLPRIVEACRDPQTRHWLAALPDDYTQTHARQHLAQMRAEQAAGRGMHWVVADPDDDHLLADLALSIRDLRDPQGEIGYWTHPQARGRGVTTEAVRLAARHGLLPAEDGGLGLSRILIRADVGNIGSRRVAEKAGFAFSGRDRNANLLRDGSRTDHLRFDLLPDELPAVR